MDFNFICIEGNIGIGKTTLVKKLSAHFNANAFYEEFDENPWLPLFYKNPEETALALELSFLTDRSKQLIKMSKINSSMTMFSDYCLDKCLLFTEINLSAKDFEQYKKLHGMTSANIVAPNLVIVIHSTTEKLLTNIKQRNRDYEQNMEASYLEKLNTSYKQFFEKENAYHVLNIFTEDLSEANYERIFNEIVTFLEHKPSFKITSLNL